MEKPTYNVYAHRWNKEKEEYEFTILGKYEEDDYETALKHFNKVRPSVDLQHIELWKNDTDDNTRIAYKDLLEDNEVDEVWGE